jgi:hypothetical protein
MTIPAVSFGDTLAVSWGNAVADQLNDFEIDDSWSPTFTGFTLGNGTESGLYRFGNGVLSCWYFCVLGSTSSVSGALFVDLPSGFSNLAGSFRVPLGVAQFTDASDANARYAGVVVYGGGTDNVQLRYPDPAAEGNELKPLSSSDPFTWTAGDAIGFHYSAPAVRV